MNCAGVWKPASNVGGTALGPEAIRVCGETARTDIKIQKISPYSRSALKTLKKNIKILQEKNETLDEESGARETINDLLDEEHETDITTLMKWTSDVEQFEEDIFTLLKFQHKDSTRIKDHHLRLERERERVGQCKKGLDNASTESRMAQVALDKTAEAFRYVLKSVQGLNDMPKYLYLYIFVV